MAQIQDYCTIAYRGLNGAPATFQFRNVFRVQRSEEFEAARLNAIVDVIS